jgi:hypothetical protein
MVLAYSPIFMQFFLFFRRAIISGFLLFYRRYWLFKRGFMFDLIETFINMVFLIKICLIFLRKK